MSRRVGGGRELEGERRRDGAVTGQVVGEVVLQYEGVETLPRHQLVARAVGLYYVDTEAEHQQLEGVESEVLQVVAQPGGDVGGEGGGARGDLTDNTGRQSGDWEVVSDVWISQ